MMKMMILWIVLTLLFVIAEAATAQLVSVWFVLGSIFALGSYFLGAGSTVQVIVFVAVSVVALLLTRPFVKKVIHKDVQKTNADKCIGKTAVVTKSISNLYATGAVQISGIPWTARSTTGEDIPEGETVIIDKIEGVKVMVSKH